MIIYANMVMYYMRLLISPSLFSFHLHAVCLKLHRESIRKPTDPDTGAFQLEFKLNFTTTCEYRKSGYLLKIVKLIK